MEKWKFGEDNDKLIKLVISGKKKATCCIFNGNPSFKGEISILLDDNNKEVCKLKTLEVKVLKFKDVTWELAVLEGENDCLIEWKKNHYEFFKRENSNFSEDSLIEFEIFELLEE